MDDADAADDDDADDDDADAEAADSRDRAGFACGSFVPTTWSKTSRAIASAVRPTSAEDLRPGRVVDERVRQPELVHAGVDTRRAEVLTQPGADAADAHAVLDGDDEPVRRVTGR